MHAVAEREETEDIEEIGVVNRSLPPLPPPMDRLPTSESAEEPALVVRSIESDFNSA